MAIKSYLVTGKALYAKIIGRPVPGYDEDSLEWTFDLEVSPDEIKKLVENGVGKQYIKTHKTTGNPYVRFTRKAVKKDGSPGAPITVVGPDGKPWDDRLIGNGSVLNVKYALNEVGKGKEMRLKPGVLAVQVWELQEYHSSGGFAVNPNYDTSDAPLPESDGKDW